MLSPIVPTHYNCLLTPRIKRRLEGQEVEHRQLTIAVEVGRRFSVFKEVKEREEVEDGQAAIGVEVGRAGLAGQVEEIDRA